MSQTTSKLIFQMNFPNLLEIKKFITVLLLAHIIICFGNYHCNLKVNLTVCAKKKHVDINFYSVAIYIW
jgi:hypothetical protein